MDGRRERVEAMYIYGQYRWDTVLLVLVEWPWPLPASERGRSRDRRPLQMWSTHNSTAHPPPTPNSDTRPNVLSVIITQQTTWHRSQYMYSKKTLLATRPVWPGQARPSNHILSSSPRPALQPPRPAPRACNHRPSPPAMGQRPIPPPPTCNQVTPGLPNKGKCIWGAGLK